MSLLTHQKRNSIGLRAACARCGLDIEYIGAGRWHDRGGDICCALPADTERLHRHGRHTPHLTATMLVRKSYTQVETPRLRNGRPSYAWVQGWEVRNLETGRWSTPMRFREALNFAHQVLAQATTQRPPKVTP